MENNLQISPYTGGFPIGTILPIITLEIANSLKGWLICDGHAIPEKYQDLIQRIGKTTPNLIGRTLIGAQNNNDIPKETNSDESKAHFGELKFAPNKYGGKAQVNINVDNLPKSNIPLLLKYKTIKTGTNAIAKDDQHKILEKIEQAKVAESESKTGELGKGTMYDNLSPYYTIIYVIYTGLNE